MSYRVEERKSNNQKIYVVIEKGSEYEMFESTSHKEARSLCRSLNLGGGFNGLTPGFFMEKFPIITS